MIDAGEGAGYEPARTESARRERAGRLIFEALGRDGWHALDRDEQRIYETAARRLGL